MRYLFLCVSMLLLASQANAAKLNVGDLPPENYIGKTTKGDKVFVQPMKGKVAIVTFWRSVCQPCMSTLPVFDAVLKNVTTDHLEVFAVNYHESASQVRWLKKLLADTKMHLLVDKKSTVAKQYGIKKVPTTLIVNRKGEIAKIYKKFDDNTIKTVLADLQLILNER